MITAIIIRIIRATDTPTAIGTTSAGAEATDPVVGGSGWFVVSDASLDVSVAVELIIVGPIFGGGVRTV